MRSGRSIAHILYTWAVIISGFWFLSYFFYAVDLDKTREYLLLIVLGVLSEWLTVSFPLGRLSGGFSIVLASFLIYGLGASAWVSALATLVGQGVANRGEPVRTVLFNAAQQVLSVTGSAYLCKNVLGISPPALNSVDLSSGLSICAFLVFYFIINHLLVYFYAYPNRRRQKTLPWLDALRWDGLTYLVTAPFGIIMGLLYVRVGMASAVFLFAPILVVQFILRLYVHVELANRELRAMYEIARRMGSGVEAAEIPNLLLKEARRAVPFHSGVFYLRSEESGVFKCAAAYGPFKSQLEKSIVRPGEGFFGFILTSGEPEVVYDTRSDPRVKGEPGMPQVYRSLLVVPMVAEVGILGVLVLGEKRPMFYEDHHLQALSVIVGSLSMALANNLLKKRNSQREKLDLQTGLFNRHHFYSACRDFWEGEGETPPGAVVIFNIDYMAQLNRRFGNPAGDMVLLETAKIIYSLMPEGSLAARYDGDGFALLLPGLSGEEALNVAENIRVAVREYHFSVEGLPRQVRLSAGVAVLPGDGKNAGQLLSQCESYLGRAKRMGKDRVVGGQQSVN